MSLGYAQKLSFRDASFLGTLGSPETFETQASVEAKVTELADLIQKSKHTVVYTGAGISTSCGIPDFRGPNGIWTLQSSGKPIPQASCSFAQARPSYAHMALKALVDAGKVHYVVSQNVDCLHLRSGIPRGQLAELHGNCFREVCSKCGAEYVRDFELETVGLKRTGRSCTAAGCEGRLRDSVLDWEDALPQDELAASEEHSKQAELALCLGTSLQIVPARNLPFKCVHGGGKVVIVNLQNTPRDKKAALVIHAKADQVMRGVMQALRITVQPYIRVDRLVLAHTVNKSLVGSTRRWSFSLRSAHGSKAPISWVKRAQVTFLHSQRDTEPLSGPKFTLKGVDDSGLPFADLRVEVEVAEGTAARPLTFAYRLHLDAEDASPSEDGPSQKVDTIVEEASTSGRVGTLIATSSRQQQMPGGFEWQTEYSIVTDVVDFDAFEAAEARQHELHLRSAEAKTGPAESSAQGKTGPPSLGECIEVCEERRASTIATRRTKRKLATVET